MRKGQGRTPLLNVRDQRALSQYFLRKRHATMMDVATWAWDYFVKSLSLNTVRCCIKKCNLRKAFIKFEQKRRWFYLGLKSFEIDRKTVETCSLSDESTCQLFFRKKLYVPKMKKTVQTVANNKCKNQPLWWYGGTSVPTAWVICIYVKVLLMRRLMLVFWRDDVFSLELHFYFSRTMPGLILHELQQRGFVGIDCICLTGLLAV